MVGTSHGSATSVGKQVYLLSSTRLLRERARAGAADRGCVASQAALHDHSRAAHAQQHGGFLLASLSRIVADFVELMQAYKSKKEAAPKAAFQFGVKVSDGRKGHRELGNRAKEQKLNNQLNQIQKRLEADGKDYSTAFTPAMTEEGGAAAASKKRRI